MPPSTIKNNLQKLHVIKKVIKITKNEKKSTKQPPLQWVFCGQKTHNPCLYDYSGEIICIG